MSIFIAIYGLVVNGALLASISTIEKRFSFSTTQSGLILASYDIGFLISVIPLERFLRNANIGRFSGAVAFAITLACFMFSVPHFGTPDVVEISANSSQESL